MLRAPPRLLGAAGTACPPRGRNSATLFSSLRRGVGGIDVDCKVAYGVCNSRHMLPVMPRSRGYNRTPPMWREPRATSRDVRRGGVKSGWHTSREGVAGSGGYCKVGHWASNSLHISPMMPRRWRAHRSARIAQEQGQSPEFAPLKSAVPRLVRTLGVVMWILR